MKKADIYVLKRDVKPVMEYLQRKGAVMIEKQQPRDGLSFTDTAYQVAYLEKRSQTAAAALEVLDEYAPQKKGLLSSLNGRKIISEKDYNEISGYRHETIRLCDNILTMSKQINECKAEIARQNAKVAMLEPWVGYDLPASAVSTEKTFFFTGTVSESLSASALFEAAGLDKSFPLSLEEVFRNKNMTAFFAVCAKEKAEEAEAALRKVGFVKFQLPGKASPAEEKSTAERRIGAMEKAVKDLATLIGTCAESREKIMTVCDYYRLRADRNKEMQKLLQTKNVSIISGYLPEDVSEGITDEINARFSAAVELKDAAREDPETPVKLKNNAFAAPAESIVESYSSPSPHDIDPTPVMAFFYYMFFGIMYCDVGYGALITLGCFIALKKFTLEKSLRKTLTMFLYCGISTIIWGFVFGGFFGDIVSVVSREFFGHQVDFPALWVNPMNDPVTVLFFSLALGFIQIVVGLVIKFINLTRNEGIWPAICETGGWLVIFTGAALAVIGMFAPVPVLTTVGAVMAIVGAAMVAFLGGYKNKNPFMKIFGGFAGLYDITSYFSDIASYARLFALALASGAFASAMNSVGVIVPGALKPFVLLIVFLIGTAINMALSFLSAYVHTLRLQYVEFFGKFYEGDGKPYEPFKAETKYIRFTEEI